MPRGAGSNGQLTPKQEQNKLLWAQLGSVYEPAVNEWDPNAEVLVSALLEVVKSGATLVLRPGSGGRSIGIAIWEGDVRHPPIWIYETEELDSWAIKVMVAVAGRTKPTSE